MQNFQSFISQSAIFPSISTPATSSVIFQSCKFIRPKTSAKTDDDSFENSNSVPRALNAWCLFYAILYFPHISLDLFSLLNRLLFAVDVNANNSVPSRMDDLKLEINKHDI